MSKYEEYVSKAIESKEKLEIARSKSEELLDIIRDIVRNLPANVRIPRYNYNGYNLDRDFLAAALYDYVYYKLLMNKHIIEQSDLSQNGLISSYEIEIFEKFISPNIPTDFFKGVDIDYFLADKFNDEFFRYEDKKVIDMFTKKFGIKGEEKEKTEEVFGILVEEKLGLPRDFTYGAHKLEKLNEFINNTAKCKLILGLNKENQKKLLLEKIKNKRHYVVILGKSYSWNFEQMQETLIKMKEKLKEKPFSNIADAIAELQKYIERVNKELEIVDKMSEEEIFTKLIDVYGVQHSYSVILANNFNMSIQDISKYTSKYEVQNMDEVAKKLEYYTDETLDSKTDNCVALSDTVKILEEYFASEFISQYENDVDSYKSLIAERKEKMQLLPKIKEDRAKKYIEIINDETFIQSFELYRQLFYPGYSKIENLIGDFFQRIHYYYRNNKISTPEDLKTLLYDQFLVDSKNLSFFENHKMNEQIKELYDLITSDNIKTAIFDHIKLAIVDENLNKDCAFLLQDIKDLRKKLNISGEQLYLDIYNKMSGIKHKTNWAYNAGELADDKEVFRYEHYQYPVIEISELKGSLFGQINKYRGELEAEVLDIMEHKDLADMDRENIIKILGIIKRQIKHGMSNENKVGYQRREINPDSELDAVYEEIVNGSAISKGM